MVSRLRTLNSGIKYKRHEIRDLERFAAKVGRLFVSLPFSKLTESRQLRQGQALQIAKKHLEGKGFESFAGHDLHAGFQEAIREQVKARGKELADLKQQKKALVTARKKAATGFLLGPLRRMMRRKA